MNAVVIGKRGLVSSALAGSQSSAEHNAVFLGRSDLDLTSTASLKKSFIDYECKLGILAAAKVGGIKANSEQQMEFLLQNLKIQNACMEAAVEAGVDTFIFLGSSCIYPKFAPQPINESSLLTGPLEPTNEGYALAKIAGIRLARAISEERGLNYFSVMPTNLYGPNDNYDLDSSHVPAALMRRFHEAKLEGKDEVVVWGTGTALREFMHVDDLARAIWYLSEMKLPGELINVGTGSDISIKDFALLMANIIGFKGKVVFDSSQPNGTPRKLLDVSKVNNLGWKSTIGLEEGLASTYEWFEQEYAKGTLRGQ